MASNANPNVYTAWGTKELNAFIKLMIDNVKKGNKTNSTFNKAGWDNIKTRLEACMGRSFNKEQLRNKMNRLRNDYKSFKKLLETTGFRWNSITRTITNDDSVWKKAIQANPTWSKFKRNGLPYWPELQLIFGDSYAREDLGISQALVISVNDGPNEVPIDVALPTPTPMDRDLDDIEDFEAEEEHLCVTQRLDRMPSTRRKRSITADVSNALLSIRKFCAWKMNGMGNTSARSTAPPPPPTMTVDYNIVTCQRLLDTIPDLRKELYMKAVKRMWEDQEWRQSFIVCIPERRAWLLEILE
ncbi:uncharacterized protein LOC122078504 isoform X2 [Macadamia integrifolia]|nr:uncharacterized protein LOC122078504 isoform X2 [Macadamia integrifolia]XP_042500450.1 uncharacterized protein LOC122078504 isoform X2 [Macadamia integrifolia]